MVHRGRRFWVAMGHLGKVAASSALVDGGAPRRAEPEHCAMVRGEAIAAQLAILRVSKGAR